MAGRRNSSIPRLKSVIIAIINSMTMNIISIIFKAYLMYSLMLILMTIVFMLTFITLVIDGVFDEKSRLK